MADSSGTPPSPRSASEVLAVLTDRVSRLNIDLQEWRLEQRQRVEDLKREVTAGREEYKRDLEARIGRIEREMDNKINALEVEVRNKVNKEEIAWGKSLFQDAIKLIVMAIVGAAIGIMATGGHIPNARPAAPMELRPK